MADLYLYQLHLDPANLLAVVKSRHVPQEGEILRIQHFNKVIVYAEVLTVEHEIQLTMHKAGHHSNRINITIREIDYSPGRI